MEQLLQQILNELQTMNQRLSNSELRQNEISQIVQAIHHQQEIADAKLEALTLDVHYIRGDLTSLKEGQERQDRILESLAMRSLEQETQLRELKRIK